MRFADRVRETTKPATLTDLTAAIRAARQGRKLLTENDHIDINTPGDDDWGNLMADESMLGRPLMAVVAMSIYSSGGRFYQSFQDAIDDINGYLGQLEADNYDPPLDDN